MPEVGQGNAWGLMQSILPMGLIALFIYLGLTYLPNLLTGAMGKLCAATGTSDDNLCKTADDAIGHVLQFATSGTGLWIILSLASLAVFGGLALTGYKLYKGDPAGKALLMEQERENEIFKASQNVQKIIDDPKSSDELKAKAEEKKESIRKSDAAKRSENSFKSRQTLEKAQGDGMNISNIELINLKTDAVNQSRIDLDGSVDRFNNGDGNEDEVSGDLDNEAENEEAETNVLDDE